MGQISIRRQLLFGFFLASLSAILIGTLSVFSLQAMTAKALLISENNLVNCVTAGVMLNKARTLQSSVLGIARLPAGDQRVSETAGKIEEALSDYERYDGMYSSNDQPATEEKAFYEKQNRLWVPAKKKLDEIVAAAKGGTVSPELTSAYLDLAEIHLGELEGILQVQNDEGFKQAQAIKKLSRQIFWTIVLGSAFSFGLALIFGWQYALRLSNKLRRFSKDLVHSSVAIRDGSGEMHDVSQSLGSANLSQASAVQESAATSSQLSATVEKNAQNCQFSLEQASSCRDSAIDGVSAIRQVIDAFQSIYSMIDETVSQADANNEKITHLLATINDISTKANFINDIVFQTKILSFNASVEAARAGEHGRGFSVVAEEIGKLAVGSGKAASEISVLLKEGVTNVQKLVSEATTQGQNLRIRAQGQMEKSSSRTQHCQAVFENIVKNVEGVVSMVGEIAAASNEQANGISVLSQAFGALDVNAQRNSMATGQVIEFASQLRGQSESLGHAAQELELLIEGAAGRAKIEAEEVQVLADDLPKAS